MSFEVEVKYRAVDHDHLLKKLGQIGAVAGAAVDHEDIYLNHPARLRPDQRGFSHPPDRRREPAYLQRPAPLRPHQDPRGDRDSHRPRHRSVSPLAQAPGKPRFPPGRHGPQATRKLPLTFQEHELEIVLDTAEGLGPFAEIETIASGQADLPAAQQAVMALAELLGLTQVEPRSYLGMILESQAGAPG